jgi:enoyl-CoA hydratase/carnithine racemase
MLYNAAQTEAFPQIRFAHLLTDLTDHVLTITLNRPAKKNALHPALLHELAFALAFAHHTPGVWLVVLAAASDTFCAGMDLRSLSQPNRVGELAEDGPTVPLPAGPVRLGELMAGLHKPCVARVQGPVYAGGFLLIAGATYVVATESATFSLPEVKRGLFPFQVLANLRHLMPERIALDLCLRAPTLSASDALRLGLVTQVVPADELDETVSRLINELKQYSPTAMQFGLRAAQALRSLPPDQEQAYMLAQFEQLQQTPDAKEGMAAFLEKRPPIWWSINR